MSYELLKSLHIIFVITWFAGLFYIVRLYVYHREALEENNEKSAILIDQYKIMERRLWYGITWPSAVLTLIFGSSLIQFFLPFKENTWLHYKLAFVIGLLIYHWLCGRIFHQLKEGKCFLSSNGLRVWNEVATLFLFAIVFLVVFKDIINMIYGVVGLVVLSVLLMIAIKMYRKIRSEK